MVMSVRYDLFKTSHFVFLATDLEDPLNMYSEPPQRSISKPWFSYFKTLMLPTSRLSVSEKSMVDSDPAIQVSGTEKSENGIISCMCFF